MCQCFNMCQYFTSHSTELPVAVPESRSNTREAEGASSGLLSFPREPKDRCGLIVDKTAQGSATSAASLPVNRRRFYDSLPVAVDKTAQLES